MSTGVLEDDAAQTPTGGPSRMRYLDSLRGTLMVLGIVLHSAARFGDHRQALSGGWEGWTGLAAFIHLWRMPAFFLIAGFFATMVLARRGVGQWWRRRVVRLGLPLVFGLVVVNAVLRLAKAQARGEPIWLEPGWAWSRFVVGQFGELAHLWFLAYLLGFCTVLAVLAFAVRHWRWGPHLRVLAGRAISRTWVVGVVLLVVVVMTAFSGLGELRWDAVFDSRRRQAGFVLYSGAFAVGALLGLAPAALGRTVDRLAWWCLPAAVVLPVLVLGADPFLAHRTWGRSLALVGCAYASSVLLLALAKRFADRGGWPTRYVIDASLPVYLVHLPVIFVVAPRLGEAAGPVAGCLLTMAATALISFALYELLNLVSVTRWLSTGRGERGTSVRDLVVSGRRPVSPEPDPHPEQPAIGPVTPTPGHPPVG